jgi:hypothetical protein
VGRWHFCRWWRKRTFGVRVNTFFQESIELRQKFCHSPHFHHSGFVIFSDRHGRISVPRQLGQHCDVSAGLPSDLHSALAEAMPLALPAFRNPIHSSPLHVVDQGMMGWNPGEESFPSAPWPPQFQGRHTLAGQRNGVVAPGLVVGDAPAIWWPRSVPRR